MRLFITALLASLIGLGASNAGANEFRLLTGWDKTHPSTALIVEPLAKNIEAASNGRIRFSISGPEAVPVFEQLQPLSSGVFQFLVTVGAYHTGTTPVLSTMDAIEGTPVEIRKSGILDIIDKHYNKLGVKVLAMGVSAPGGFQLILRDPVGPSGDLQGRKIRATPTYHGVLKLLNSVPVFLPTGEIYTALGKGLVDGAAAPAIGVLAYRWNEVAKYMARPSFGVVAYPILANLKAWDALSEDDRRLILREAQKVEDHYYQESGRLADEEEKTLLAKGMTVTKIGDTQAAKLRAAYQSGIWDLAATKDAKEVEAIRQFARAKNLSQ